jgi:hypothetical protein
METHDHPLIVASIYILFWSFIITVLIQNLADRPRAPVREVTEEPDSDSDSSSNSDSESSGSSTASVKYYGKLRGWYNVRKMLNYADNIDGGQTKTDELNLAFISDSITNADFLRRVRNIATKDNIDVIVVANADLVANVRKAVGRKHVYARSEVTPEQIHNKRVMFIHEANRTSLPMEATPEVDFKLNIFLWTTNDLLVSDLEASTLAYFDWGPDDSTDSNFESESEISSISHSDSGSDSGSDDDAEGDTASTSDAENDDERAEAESTTISETFTSLSAPTWPFIDMLIVLDPTSLSSQWITERILHAWWDPSVYDVDLADRDARLYLGPRFVVQPTSVSYVVS